MFVGIVTTSCGGTAPTDDASADTVIPTDPTPALAPSTSTTTVQQVETTTTSIAPVETTPVTTTTVLEIDNPSGRDDDYCRLLDARAERYSPSVGFPRIENLRTEGRLNIELAVIDFDDLPAESDLLDDAVAQAGRLSDWLTEMSQGRLQADWEIVPEVVRLPFASTDLPVSKRGPEYVTQALAASDVLVEALDPFIDFSESDLLVVVPPRAIEAIDTDITFINISPESDEGVVPRLFASGAFFYEPGPYDGDPTDVDDDRLWSFWAHELMHAFGLAGHAPDSLEFGSAPDPRTDVHLGSTQDALSKALSTWDLFLLGWLADEEVICLDASDLPLEVQLEAVEARSGSRPISAMVRLSDNELLVVESKRAVGFGVDLAPSTGGVMAYRVDTTIENNRAADTWDGQLGERFAWFLEPENADAGDRFESGVNPFIREGGSALSDGVRVAVVDSSGRDIVSLTSSS